MYTSYLILTESSKNSHSTRLSTRHDQTNNLPGRYDAHANHIVQGYD